MKCPHNLYDQIRSSGYIIAICVYLLRIDVVVRGRARAKHTRSKSTEYVLLFRLTSLARSLSHTFNIVVAVAITYVRHLHMCVAEERLQIDFSLLASAKNILACTNMISQQYAGTAKATQQIPYMNGFLQLQFHCQFIFCLFYISSFSLQ